MENNNKSSELTHSYLSLRRTVGWIGILLPFVLIIGFAIFFTNEQTPYSISHYYHTEMRNIFVGSLCAVSLFFFFYSGYDRIDNWFGNIAGVSAIGVACLPITNNTIDEPEILDTIGVLHYICAVVFFLTLIFFSLVLFVKSDKTQEITKQKKLRNKIYRTCGVIMILCILSIALQGLVGLPKKTVFWAETIALSMFGLSWLTKGEAIMPDK